MSTPKNIGRYEIQQVLGYGAMGVVYLARDPILHRPVAIKAMRELGEGRGEDQQNTRERFRREAEISAKLNHPNIITIFDVGDDPAVGPYLAMEYVNGQSLAQLIREGLPVESGIGLLLQGMGALQAAEESGIVHRDIKPENVLVSSEGRFKLMDFGIARRGESKLTQAGMVFGTPSYTAPELLVGAEATPGTDRYAFAVTAFEIITGTVPYHGTSIGTTLYKIVHEAPQMPEELDPDLKRVFDKAFAKKPEDRYPDLRTFMSSLIAVAPIGEEARHRFRSQLEEDRGPLDTKVYPPMMVAQQHGLDSHAASGPLPDGSQAGPSRASTVPDGGTPSLGSSRSRWIPLATGLVVLGLGAGALAWFLQPRTLDIFSNPLGAEVLLDGKSLGLTPLTRKQVPRDAKTLQFRMEGFLTLDMKVPAKSGEIMPTLERNPFIVRVVTDPPGAEVYLKDRLVGKSPIEQLSVPSQGAPEMRIRLDGYEEKRFVVDNEEAFPPVILLNPVRPGK